MDKLDLLDKGIVLLERFCKLNKIKAPNIIVMEPSHKYYNLGSCAFYRTGTIWIAPRKCAHPGNGKMSWSWPGYVIDRTPYGVPQHELGHYVDHITPGLFKGWKGLLEKPITGYHGTGDNWVRDESRREDFAEMFRLFVTNPDLLASIRSNTYEYFVNKGDGFKEVENRTWRKVLEGAPKGIIRAAHNKVDKEFYNDNC